MKYEDLARRWVAGYKPREGKGQFSYHRSVAFSYGTAIAARYDFPTERAYLVTTISYSNSTSVVVGLINAALHGVPHFNVPHVLMPVEMPSIPEADKIESRREWFQNNYDHFTGEIAQLQKSMAHANTREENKPHYKASIKIMRGQRQRFTKLFGDMKN